MKIIRSLRTLVRWRQSLQREGVRIGFVPTMGALHAGHQSLIRKARLTSDAVVVSIFVNPTQFSPHEDLDRYPRPFRQDTALCRGEGVDVIFAPTPQTIYPKNFQTTVQVLPLSERWEGASRPTHFSGVTTIVTKLFSLVQPDKVFFGQKDFQQTQIVNQLVKDLNFSCRVIMCPTFREPDGLALSSRNTYLSPPQRQAATILYQALKAGQTAIQQGNRHAHQIRKKMKQVVAREPLAHLEYIDICDKETLRPLPTVTTSAVLLGAIRVGSVRLIDNLLVGKP